MTSVQPRYEDRYGTEFLRHQAPDRRLPEHGIATVDAMRLLGEELILDGIPMRDLATFVTTWVEPEAQCIIAENLHRNYGMGGHLGRSAKWSDLRRGTDAT